MTPIETASTVATFMALGLSLWLVLQMRGYMLRTAKAEDDAAYWNHRAGVLKYALDMERGLIARRERRTSPENPANKGWKTRREKAA